MKILFLAPWSDWEMGGASSHMHALEKVISLTGNTSALLSHNDLPRRARDACWLVANLFPGRRLQVSTLLTEVLHALYGLREAAHSGTRVVNAHHVSCLLAARWIGRFVDAPVILTVHSYYTRGDLHAGFLRRGSRDERFALALEKYAYRHADFIFAVDTRIRDYVLAEAGPDPRKVSVRLNFVDTSEFMPRERAAAFDALAQGGVELDASLRGGAQLVLCPRRLSPKNGVEYFIRAAKIVASRKPRVRFLIAGEGIQLPELLQLRASLHLEDRVTFLGGVVPPLIRYLYNVVDAVVVPSITVEGIQEASSIAALEAMASGVPLICSAIGGLKELVADGETGYLVPEKSPERLADAVVRSLEEDQSAITARALEHVRQNHSLESYARDLEAFLAGHGLA